MTAAGNNGMVMNHRDTRLELGRFLRERREQLSPQEAGLPMTARRRTPGLRREEVASEAGISTTYYTKIEQGRVDVSERVLDAIAVVLKLNHTEKNYAIALASGRSAERPDRPDEIVSPGLKLLMAQHEPYPVQIINRRWDFLDWNEGASASIVDLEMIPQQSRNLLKMLFLIPVAQHIIIDWEAQARRTLAEFRADYGKYHNDPSFGELIAELMDNSPEFSEWWSELKDVGSAAEAQFDINHPIAGELSLLQTVLMSYDHPGVRIMMFLPRDEGTKEKLQQLYDARMVGREKRPEAA